MENKTLAPVRSSGPPPLSMDGMLTRPRSAVHAVGTTPRPIFVQIDEPQVQVELPPEVVIETPRYAEPERPHSVRIGWKSVVIAACLALFSGIVLYGHISVSGHGNGVAKAASLTKSTTTAAVVSTPVVTTPAVDIAADMNAVIGAQTSLSASASLIDLNSGKEYDAGNYTQQYTAASTSKLVAVFDYIHQVELGKASLSQNIRGQQAQDIIMRMIVYSDNNAWAKLNSYLQFKQEQAYVNSLGVSATIQPSNLQFSTPNMAKLLLLLYQGKLMNDTNRTMIYGYMSHTTIKNLIQAALPADATVYHKYGQVDGVLHDASIVDYHGHQFILVIYTNNPAGTTSQSVQQVSLIHAITTVAFKDITAN